MYIFSFDVESNGLYGEGFAFGAVVMDEHGQELAAAQACCLKNVSDSWVTENVLPYLADMPQLASREEVRHAFWEFYMQWKGKCHVVADVAYPVDMEFLRQSALEHHGEWDAPFPLLDVASIMFACGEDPLTDGAAFTGCIGDNHQPLFDARVSAHKLVRLIREKKLVLP